MVGAIVFSELSPPDLSKLIVIPSEYNERGNLPPAIARGDCHEPKRLSQ